MTLPAVVTDSSPAIPEDYTKGMEITGVNRDVSLTVARKSPQGSDSFYFAVIDGEDNGHQIEIPSFAAKALVKFLSGSQTTD